MQKPKQNNMIKNEDGLVKCLRKDGTTVWMAEHIVTNSKIMKNCGLILAPSIVKIEPVIEPILETNIEPTIEGQVAQTSEAKRTRTTKTKE